MHTKGIGLNSIEFQAQKISYKEKEGTAGGKTTTDRSDTEDMWRELSSYSQTKLDPRQEFH